MPHSMYAKDGIPVPDTRVSKLTATIIFAVFGAAVYFGYQKAMPKLEAYNQAASAEAAAPDQASEKSSSRH